MSMESKKCPHCGGPLVDGLCPKCLARLSLGHSQDTNGSSSEEMPASAGSGEALLISTGVPAPPPPEPTKDQPATNVVPGEAPGDRIGPYKLLEIIGEGGMGTVWMAERTEPIHQRVALKIVKPGMDSKEIIARFEAERQALALMDHPNIAKVLDAGATPNGRPYFVMELVKGIPITRYCDEQRLPVGERLELFIAVCHAVQHAHQKGIIHRDLKPSNIMVALYDGKPVPKVIDFGIAKALGQHLTEKTLFTQLGQLLGTLEYMSPEQAELNQLDIDTRSDIYSLGVLLYELLTGSTPLQRETLKKAAYDEILKRIREEEPQKPSLRLSTSRDQLPVVSAQRKLEPQKLSKLVRGDLDWIVMMAIEKDRNRRYETASAFARDVEHHLNNEPVLAGPPTVRYRLKKFVRRHQVAAAFALLLAVAAVALWANMERERSVPDTSQAVAPTEPQKREFPPATDVTNEARKTTDPRTNGLLSQGVEKQ